MPEDRLFIAPAVTLFDEEWFLFMSAEARCACMYMLRHVKTEAFSQKKSGRAPRLSPAVAAHQWRTTIEAVREMEEAAIKGEFLTIEDGLWVVHDRLIFRSEKSAYRDAKAAAEEAAAVVAQEEVEPKDPSVPVSQDLSDKSGQTKPNGDKDGQPCQISGSGSDSDSGSGSGSDTKVPPTAGGEPPKGEPPATAAPPPDGGEEGEREPSEPFRSIRDVLTLCVAGTEIPKPTSEDVRPHLREGSHIRLLIDKLGVERTASLWRYAQSTKEGRGGMPWSSVWTQHVALLKSMPQPPPSADSEQEGGDVFDRAAKLHAQTVGVS